MTEQTSIAAQMRVQYDDLLDLYNDAKRDENGALMEKYAKTLGNLAKQIKDQEEHERVTIPRAEAVTFARELAYSAHDVIKQHIADSDLRAEITNGIRDAFKSKVEGLRDGD
jgi:hypothetical protein